MAKKPKQCEFMQLTPHENDQQKLIVRKKSISFLTQCPNECTCIWIDPEECPLLVKESLADIAILLGMTFRGWEDSDQS